MCIAFAPLQSEIVSCNIVSWDGDMYSLRKGLGRNKCTIKFSSLLITTQNEQHRHTHTDTHRHTQTHTHTNNSFGVFFDEEHVMLTFFFYTAGSY